MKHVHSPSMHYHRAPLHFIDRLLPVRVCHTAIHLALALLLLLTQQLGAVHAVRHLGADAVHRTADEKKLPLDAQCEQCLAYASIGSALTGEPVTPFIARHAIRVTVPVVALVLLPPAYSLFRPRAPPSAS